MKQKNEKNITNHRIIEEALKILDEKGREGLTMRRLAAALNVKAASLYHHVPNKQALIQKIVDGILSEARVLENESANWKEVSVTFSNKYRDVLRTHPGAISFVATHPVSAETGAELIYPLMTSMKKTKMTETQALHFIQSLAVFINGHALAEIGNWPEPPTAPQSYYDQWFVNGIKALILGFENQFDDQKG